jgi:hypothetical protein
MSVCAAVIPKLNKTNWVAWSTLQATCLRQLFVWSVITEEHPAPALKLLQAATNKDGTTILLITDQKALNIRIRLDNHAAAECFRSARKRRLPATSLSTSLSRSTPVSGALRTTPWPCGTSYRASTASRSLVYALARTTTYCLAPAHSRSRLQGPRSRSGAAPGVVHHCPAQQGPCHHGYAPPPQPDYAPLLVFGCRAFAHVGKDKRKSLDLHTTPCVFFGYPEDYCGWKLWDPRAKRVCWRPSSACHQCRRIFLQLTTAELGHQYPCYWSAVPSPYIIPLPRPVLH